MLGEDHPDQTDGREGWRKTLTTAVRHLMCQSDTQVTGNSISRVDT
jgi:hypothetical protein